VSPHAVGSLPIRAVIRPEASIRCEACLAVSRRHLVVSKAMSVTLTRPVTESGAEDRAADFRRSTASGSPVGWSPTKDDMKHPEWVAVGRRLSGISRCNQWWLGDWVRYGEARWGRKYVEAAKITGYDPRSLANMASVALSFDLSRRRDNLTWSHHAALAALEPEEQDKWLDRAATDRLSVADLRQELRCSQRTSKVDAARDIDSTSAPEVEEALICPHCGHEVPLPPARTGVIDVTLKSR
jgi:hypothetical protein